MSFTFSERSLRNLKEVHQDLQCLMHEAIKITPIDFGVIEGLRTVSRQKQLLKAGATTTMRSRHLTGHAVDVAVFVNGKIQWDWPLYESLSVYIKETAQKINVPIEWGGDWKTFKDGPHYQLPWQKYP